MYARVCGCVDLFRVFGAPLQFVWGAAMQEGLGDVCHMGMGELGRWGGLTLFAQGHACV